MNNGQGGYQMSKEQSLREAIHDIVDEFTEPGKGERHVSELEKNILSAIDSRLPQEKATSPEETGGNPITSMQNQMYNTALSDVRKELGL